MIGGCRGAEEAAAPSMPGCCAGNDSGKWTGNDRWMRDGNQILKRVFYQSAFASLRSSSQSRAFYDRKRATGKRHTQTLIALARRRVNVLWAMLRDGTTFETGLQLDNFLEIPFKAAPEDILRTGWVRPTFRALAVGRTHFGTTPSGDGSFGCCVLDASQVLAAQINIRCSNVLLEVVAALGPGYRDDVLTLCGQPR